MSQTGLKARRPGGPWQDMGPVGWIEAAEQRAKDFDVQRITIEVTDGTISREYDVRRDVTFTVTNPRQGA